MQLISTQKKGKQMFLVEWESFTIFVNLKGKNTEN